MRFHLFSRRRRDLELEEEIRTHIAMSVRDRVARGEDPKQAEHAARREFGNEALVRELTRRMWGWGWLERLGEDLLYALRGMRRDPAFASMAILVLALGIGATVATFHIVDGLLLRGPTDVAAPQQLVRVYVVRHTASAQVATSAEQPYVLYATVRDHASAFSAVCMNASDSIRLGSGVEARFVPVRYVTPDLFSVARVRPALGRFFGPAEDRPPEGAAVVILGYGFWQTEFGGDRTIIGRSVTLGDRQFQVVGVTPTGFTGMERAPVDAWLPMSDRPRAPRAARDWSNSWRSEPGAIVGRLAVPRAVAEAELTTLLRSAYTGRNRSMEQARVSLRPIYYNMHGVEPPEFGVARLLAALALVMLLIAAANTTNLMLARTLRRQGELHMRLVLGAGRSRVARLLVGESLAIALLGGLFGLVLAHWGGELIRGMLFPGMAWNASAVSGRVLLWTAVVTLLTGVSVAVIPALRAGSDHNVSALLRSRSGGGEARATARTMLQVVQFALSVVLLYTAGLFVRSLYDIHNLDLGYDRGRVLAVDVTYPPPDSLGQNGAAADIEAARTRYQDLSSRFARLPGVARVSLAVGSPLSSLNVLRIQIPGRDSLPPSKGGITMITQAAPGYFKTVGTRILRGHGFTTAGMSGTEPMVVVNETLAKTIWPGSDPIGQCIVLAGWSGGACARVVGVVQNVHHVSLKEPAFNQSYVPWGQGQHSVRGTVLLVHTSDDVRAVRQELMDVLRRAAPAIQSVQINSFEQILDPQARPWRVGATLFGLFGLTVLLVAMIGLFSVVSYSATQRRRELGVRMALGARRGRVLRLMIGRGVRSALAGAAVGIVLSLAIGGFIQPLLFDNRARDPWMLAAVGTVLLGVAAVASLWPSWQATRVDPLLALRAE